MPSGHGGALSFWSEETFETWLFSFLFHFPFLAAVTCISCGTMSNTEPFHSAPLTNPLANAFCSEGRGGGAASCPGDVTVGISAEAAIQHSIGLPAVWYFLASPKDVQAIFQI